MKFTLVALSWSEKSLVIRRNLYWGLEAHLPKGYSVFELRHSRINYQSVVNPDALHAAVLKTSEAVSSLRNTSGDPVRDGT